MKLWVTTELYGGDAVQVALSKPEGRFGQGLTEMEIPGTVEKGDWVYAVIVTYTTGNTFGSNSGNQAFAALLTEADKAFNLAEAIKAHERMINSREWRSKPYSERGWENESYLEFEGERYYTGTWTGYFESIDTVDVTRVAVGA